MKQIQLKKEEPYIACLKTIKKIFEGNKIDFWLAYGTLLGAIRSGKMLDNDLDLGTFYHYLSKRGKRKKLTRDFEKEGYTIHFFWDAMSIRKGKTNADFNFFYLGKDKKSVIKKRYKKNKSLDYLIFKLMKLPTTEYYGKFSFDFVRDFRNTIKIDLLKIVHCLPNLIKKSLFKIPNFLLHKWITLEEYNLTIPAEHFLKLKTIDFYGIKVNVPSKAEKYLEIEYGKDWKTPPKEPKKWVWWENGEWKKIK